MKISVLTPSIRPLGLEIVRIGLLKQTFTDFEWIVEIGLGTHDLNAAYNRMLRRAKGELVVSLQDYSLIRPDYLEKWWEAYLQNTDTFMTAPVGKVDDLNYASQPRWDWRAYRNDETKNIRPCEPETWEIDNAAAPLQALKEIGGFDEALDGIWSSDNVNVACRAQLAGYKFACLFNNPVLAYDHDKFMEHPFRETFSGSLNTKRMAMFRGGMKIDFLN